MSCNQKTLCTPDGEAKVLVVNPGSTDPANPPAGYVNGVPYAGDLDSLVQCETDIDILTVSCETEAGDLIEVIDGPTDDEDEVRFRIDPNGPIIENCDGPQASKGPGCNGFRKGPNGGAAVHYEDFTEFGAAAEGPLTITPTAASVGAGWEDVSSEIEVTLTNPSPCDNMKYLAIFVLGGTAYRPSAGNSWLVALQYDNGGGTFINATNSWVGNGGGSVVTSPDTLKFPMSAFPQVGTVLPCQSRVLRSKVRRLTQTFAPGPDLLTMNDGSSHFIRVLGTTGN